MSLFSAMGKSIQAAIDFLRAQDQLRLVLGSDAVELAAEMARTTYLDQFQAIDAVKDCWAYDGRSLAKTRETIVRADKAGISVRAVLQLESQLQRHPMLSKYVADGCADPTMAGEHGPGCQCPPLWPAADAPSTLREDLEAAVEAVANAPYQPVIRYRHPADVPKSHGN